MYHPILQVYTEPHSKKEWATEDDLINLSNLIPIASHVKAIYNRDSFMRQFEQWFMKHHMGTFSHDSFILAPDARRNYFAGRFPEFRNNLKALDAVTESLYISDYNYMDNLLSELVSSFSDHRSCYVMESDNPPVPFDRFIRTATPGMPYHIGAVLEYHG